MRLAAVYADVSVSLAQIAMQAATSTQDALYLDAVTVLGDQELLCGAVAAA